MWYLKRPTLLVHNGWLKMIYITWFVFLADFRRAKILDTRYDRMIKNNDNKNNKYGMTENCPMINI